MSHNEKLHVQLYRESFVGKISSGSSLLESKRVITPNCPAAGDSLGPLMQIVIIYSGVAHY